MLTGAYHPGHSLLHRASPGIKLLTLLAFTTILVLWPGPLTLGGGLALVVVGYAAARIPVRLAWAQVWPMRWWVLVLVPFQVWTAGWRTAVEVVATLVLAVAAASLVTVTTRVSDMIDAIQRGMSPLVRFGVDPERVGLVLALTVRAVPVLMDAFRAHREARAARGAERSPRATLTPVVVRAIRHAQGVGQALAARGVDD